LVDYSLEDLKKYLESKFDGFMNWKNYGSYWHIDHITPIDYFNITSTTCEDFKKCWSLSNLQPLEAKENIKKSNKLSWRQGITNKLFYGQ
jgi:5-methylcytosine-specific restriction endonuclease McrA